MFGKQKVAMLLAEFMGVIVLATSVFSVVRWQLPSMFVAVTAGVVLALLVSTIGSVSGAHVNPAITLGLWSIRKINTGRAILYVAAQLLAGLATVALIKYLLGTEMDSVITGSFEWKILIAEAIGAFIFGFGVASALYQRQEKNQLAFTIGLSLTVGILIASLASNGILNPAVAVGLKSWSWAYAVGPIIGSIIGMNIYALLFSDTDLNFKSFNIRAAATNKSFIRARLDFLRPAATRPSKTAKSSRNRPTTAKAVKSTKTTAKKKTTTKRKK